VRPSGIITLLTDFGVADAYVAVMKGVILSLNPAARLVDVTHEVQQGSILQASAILKDAYPFFPPGTVHLVVVDPGVGSPRRAIVLKTESHLFVGPDNGLFWPTFKEHREAVVYHLTGRDFFLPCVSHTFHGRDIFAPVAAHLSLGIEPEKMGEPVTDPISLPLPEVTYRAGRIMGRISRIDHFGNLITDIPLELLRKVTKPEEAEVRIGTLLIKGVRDTYSEAKEGELLAVVGSSEHLEIAVNQGRACDRLEGSSKGIIGTEIEVGRGTGTQTEKA
jgi:S-adenosylmethionine hydrolase